MTAGALADAFGRKRLFAGGVLAFSVASVIIVWVPSIAWLDALRAVQGIAAAAALAGRSAALAQEFDGIARTRAFSFLGTSFGAGLAFGPVLAGLLIEHQGWRSVFLSNAFVGTFALLLGVPRMHESRDPDAIRFDWLGAVSFTSTLGLFTWGVLQLPTSGWSSNRAWVLLGGALLSLAVFFYAARRAPPHVRSVTIPVSTVHWRTNAAGRDLLLLCGAAGSVAVETHRHRWEKRSQRGTDHDCAIPSDAGGSQHRR